MGRALDLGVDALAAYRLTRLVTADTITADLRGRVIAWAYQREHGVAGLNRYLIDNELDQGALQADYWDMVVDLDDEPPKVAELVRCRWCTGVWVGVAVATARRVAPRPWGYAADALALAAAATLIAGLES